MVGHRIFLIVSMLVVLSGCANGLALSDLKQDEYWLARNVNATNLSALVVNKDVRWHRNIFTDQGQVSYVTYEFTAEVLESFKGEDLDTLRYRLTGEAGWRPKIDSAPQIVSLCRSKDGSFWFEPDDGYVYKASKSYIKVARNAKKLWATERPVNVCCE